MAVKGNVDVWDVGTGRRRHHFTLPGFAARRVALSADGRHLAALTSDRLTVWDSESSKQVITLACGPRPGEFVFEGTTPQIALGDQGWYLATAFRRHAGRAPSDATPAPFVRLLELKLGRELFTVRLSEPVFGKPAAAVALSPDGRFLAMGLQTGRVAVYELARGGTPQFHVDDGLVGFSADGRYLATSGTDVDSQTSKAYSTSDLRWFATGVAADVVHIWNVATRQEVARVRYEPGSRPVGLSRAGDYLTVLGPDGTVRIAPLEPGALLNAACGRLIRNLTVAEWRRFVGGLPPESTCPALPPPK